MGLDALLDNTDRSSKHSVMYDKQMYQIALQIWITLKCYKVSHSSYRYVLPVSLSLNFLVQFCFKASYFHVNWQFWDKCTEQPPNGLKHWKVKGISYTWNNYPPRVPSFNPFHSTASHFQVTGHFEISVPNYANGPKMTLNTTRSKVPHIHVCNYPWVPNFTFCSKATRFRVTGHFETRVSNGSKMALNTKHAKRSKVPHYTGMLSITIKLLLLLWLGSFTIEEN